MENTAIKRYYNGILNILDKIFSQEIDKIETAAKMIKETLDNGSTVHIYGSGHSQIFAQELFYRAGGLATINAMLDLGSSLYSGALKSTEIERLTGYGKVLVNYYDVSEGDVVIVVSTSGRNPVPIDVALGSKEKGAKVIAITSLEFSSKFDSRHPSGKRLFEVADLVIDSHVPAGDALVSYENTELKAAPSSTVATASILNSIIARIVELYIKEGKLPPVWLSSNLPQGDEANKEIIRKYKNRIKHL